MLATDAATPSLVGKTATGDRLDIGALVQQCGVSVPNIVDQLEATALTDLSAAGLQAGVRSEAYHGTVAAGRVISSSAGRRRPGPARLLGRLCREQGHRPGQRARPRRHSSRPPRSLTSPPPGSAGARTEAYHGTVAAGRVISQAPAAGTPVVPPGSAVGYVVSKGLAPVTVPDLVGAAEATALIPQRRRAPRVSRPAWPTTARSPPAVVISQAAAGARPWSPGSSVGYVVSKGPRPRVPDVVGKPRPRPPLIPQRRRAHAGATDHRPTTARSRPAGSSARRRPRARP